MPPKKGAAKKKSTKPTKNQEPEVVEEVQQEHEQDVQMEAQESAIPEPVAAAGQAVKDVVEAASEFVESMNGEPEVNGDADAGSKLTMEERKAKMEQLRAKMVRPIHSTYPNTPSTVR